MESFTGQERQIRCWRWRCFAGSACRRVEPGRSFAARWAIPAAARLARMVWVGSGWDHTCDGKGCVCRRKMACGRRGLRAARRRRICGVCGRAQRHVDAGSQRFTLVEAAALPEAFGAAYLFLFEEARMRAGDTVLMQAGASGLASVVIPMAKAFGARVITTVLSGEIASPSRTSRPIAW